MVRVMVIVALLAATSASGCAQASCQMHPAPGFQDPSAMARAVAGHLGILPAPAEGPGPWVAGAIVLTPHQEPGGWGLRIEWNGAGNLPLLPLDPAAAKATLGSVMRSLGVADADWNLATASPFGGALSGRILQGSQEVGHFQIGPGVYVQELDFGPMTACS